MKTENMYCERCKKYTAIFHLSGFLAGERKELHLCNFCASETEIEKELEKSAMYKKAIFTSEIPKIENAVNSESGLVCLNCGLTEQDLKIIKKPGCPSCYKYLKSDFIEKNENIKKYAGKRPFNYVEVIAQNPEHGNAAHIDVNPLEMENLENSLRVAVSEEKYEEAAVLRDKIKELNRSLM